MSNRCVRILVYFCSVYLSAAPYVSAESPQEYVQNYDSLDYSTTAWSDKTNGFSARVTYPMECAFGEPLDLEFEFASRGMPSDWSKMYWTLCGAATVKLTNLTTDSSRSFETDDFQTSRVECIQGEECYAHGTVSVPVAKIDSFVPVFYYPGGQTEKSKVLEIVSVPGGQYRVDITIHGPKHRINVTYHDLELPSFILQVRPSVEPVRPLVVEFPTGIKLDENCQLAFSGAEYSSIHIRQHRFVGLTLQGGLMSTPLTDTLRLARLIRLPSAASFQGRFTDRYSIFEATDPPGHFWPYGAHEVRTLLMKDVSFMLSKADMKRLDACKKAKSEPSHQDSD